MFCCVAERFGSFLHFLRVRACEFSLAGKKAGTTFLTVGETFRRVTFVRALRRDPRRCRAFSHTSLAAKCSRRYSLISVMERNAPPAVFTPASIAVIK